MKDKTIGDLIREARKEKGLTQKQLGELCGMSESQIGQYENGIRKPKQETLDKIMSPLGKFAFLFTSETKYLENKENELEKYFNFNNLGTFLEELNKIEEFALKNIEITETTLEKGYFDSFLKQDENVCFDVLGNDLILTTDDIKKIDSHCREAYKKQLKLELFEALLRKEKANKESTNK